MRSKLKEAVVLTIEYALIITNAVAAGILISVASVFLWAYIVAQVIKY